MKKKILLDLFCKAGGAGMGYYQAGFEVVGVDIEKQKRYPFEFVQDDAIEYLIANGYKFDAIHASPPCQAYSSSTPTQNRAKHPDLIKQVRFFCIKQKKPYVIENVAGAKRHLLNPIMICGTMFNLNVVRHRYFETNWPIDQVLKCNHIRTTVQQGKRPDRAKNYHCVTGNFSDIEFAREAMGIDWMGQKELAQAIPPAYTKYIGEHLLKHLYNAQIYLPNKIF